MLDFHSLTWMHTNRIIGLWIFLYLLICVESNPLNRRVMYLLRDQPRFKIRHATWLLTMKLAAILSSNQSSQTSRLFENHLRNCPGTQKIFTLLLNLRLVCSFIKRTNGILLSDQTPEISQFKVTLHISRKHIWKINRTHSTNWWLKHSLYNWEDTEATTKQAVDISWLGYVCS